MQKIKQNLKYIAKSIENGTYKEQSAILTLMIQETIQDIKEKEFSYEVSYSTENYKYHFLTYINMAKKYKARLHADMEEVERELFARKGKPERALKLIQGMLETNLYRDMVNNKINKWVNTTKATSKTYSVYAK